MPYFTLDCPISLSTNANSYFTVKEINEPINLDKIISLNNLSLFIIKNRLQCKSIPFQFYLKKDFKKNSLSIIKSVISSILSQVYESNSIQQNNFAIKQLQDTVDQCDKQEEWIKDINIAVEVDKSKKRPGSPLISNDNSNSKQKKISSTPFNNIEPSSLEQIAPPFLWYHLPIIKIIEEKHRFILENKNINHLMDYFRELYSKIDFVLTNNIYILYYNQVDGLNLTDNELHIRSLKELLSLLIQQKSLLSIVACDQEKLKLSKKHYDLITTINKALSHSNLSVTLTEYLTTLPNAMPSVVPQKSSFCNMESINISPESSIAITAQKPTIHPQIIPFNITASDTSFSSSSPTTLLATQTTYLDDFLKSYEYLTNTSLPYEIPSTSKSNVFQPAHSSYDMKSTSTLPTSSIVSPISQILCLDDFLESYDYTTANTSFSSSSNSTPNVALQETSFHNMESINTSPQPTNTAPYPSEEQQNLHFPLDFSASTMNKRAIDLQKSAPILEPKNTNLYYYEDDSALNPYQNITPPSTNTTLNSLEPSENMPQETNAALLTSQQDSELNPYPNINTISTNTTLSSLEPSKNMPQETNAALLTSQQDSELNPYSNINTISTNFLPFAEDWELNPYSNITSISTNFLPFAEDWELNTYSNITSISTNLLPSEEDWELNPYSNITSISKNLLPSEEDWELDPHSNITTTSTDTTISHLEPSENIPKPTNADIINSKEDSDLNPYSNITTTSTDTTISHLEPSENIPKPTNADIINSKEDSDLNPHSNITTTSTDTTISYLETHVHKSQVKKKPIPAKRKKRCLKRPADLMYTSTNNSPRRLRSSKETKKTTLPQEKDLHLNPSFNLSTSTIVNKRLSKLRNFITNSKAKKTTTFHQEKDLHLNPSIELSTSTIVNSSSFSIKTSRIPLFIIELTSEEHIPQIYTFSYILKNKEINDYMSYFYARKSIFKTVEIVKFLCNIKDVENMPVMEYLEPFTKKSQRILKPEMLKILHEAFHEMLFFLPLQYPNLLFPPFIGSPKQAIEEVISLITKQLDGYIPLKSSPHILEKILKEADDNLSKKI
ncbi:hypothetical protein CLAVI_000979 [Candidatus Clavichlamydia salmonicola]|uniref:hypothetical protein n=1 Tax=Candidatus Clavichlamydia salmonicola TaxID=469812 RepID=UPI0018914BAE|nr:hypothetical protein [Candidatus Clavichlamydia salmonicola]MBF5051336.1 hypothetical protein [Candidatus Clavichlamydia salmonicola]